MRADHRQDVPRSVRAGGRRLHRTPWAEQRTRGVHAGDERRWGNKGGNWRTEGDPQSAVPSYSGPREGRPHCAAFAGLPQERAAYGARGAPPNNTREGRRRHRPRWRTLSLVREDPRRRKAVRVLAVRGRPTVFCCCRMTRTVSSLTSVLHFRRLAGTPWFSGPHSCFASGTPKPALADPAEPLFIASGRLLQAPALVDIEIARVHSHHGLCGEQRRRGQAVCSVGDE